MARTKKSKQKFFNGLLAVALVLGGIFLYVNNSRKLGSVNEITSIPESTQLLGQQYVLLVDPTPPPTSSDSGKPVRILVGEKAAFNLIAKPLTDMLFSDITALEGKMLFDPSVILINDFVSTSLPVILKSWVINKIDSSHAELVFSYGVKPMLGNNKRACSTESGICVGKGGECVSYFNGCEKGDKCENGREGQTCTTPTATLLWIKYQTLKPGVTKIEFPVKDLKLATLYGRGNSYELDGSRLSLVVNSIVEQPSPFPSIIPIQREDLNRDGKVDLLDYNILLRNYGRRGENIADIDNNKLVDVFDYSLMIKALKNSFSW